MASTHRYLAFRSLLSTFGGFPLGIPLLLACAACGAGESMEDGATTLWPNIAPKASASNSHVTSFLDPQKLPASGPFFDGWYYRTTDPDRQRSVAIIAGVFVGENADAPAKGYGAVLWSDGPQSPVRTFEVFPQKVSVLSHGAPPSRPPSLGSESDFRIDLEGFGTVTHDQVDVAIPGRVSVSLRLGERRPYGIRAQGAGPEGLATWLPLPLHWHVDSLGSRSRYRVVETLGQGTVKEAKGQGFTHQEKNWGQAFPEAWIWGQATAPDNEAHLVFGGGRLRLAQLPVEPYLVGYRSPGHRIDIGMQGPHWVTKTIDACEGTFEATWASPTHTLELHASAPPSTFGPVAIPTRTGFLSQGGFESFSARMEVILFQRDVTSLLTPKGREVERRVFENAALEFGADYKCNR